VAHLAPACKTYLHKTKKSDKQNEKARHDVTALHGWALSGEGVAARMNGQCRAFGQLCWLPAAPWRYQATVRVGRGMYALAATWRAHFHIFGGRTGEGREGQGAIFFISTSAVALRHLLCALLL
jgi:hypothetical protein